MTFDRFGSGDVEGTFADDMQRARGYKPITEEDLKKAYSQYSGQGIQFGTVKKTDTDTALYAKAKATVIAWWKKQQADKAAAIPKPVTSPTTTSPLNPPPATSTQPLTNEQVAATLRTMGAPATWVPPTYARSSLYELEAWVQRAARNTQTTLAIRTTTQPFDDAYITRVIQNLGIVGVTASSVPVDWRVSPQMLSSYLLAQQAAYKLYLANQARLG